MSMSVVLFPLVVLCMLLILTQNTVLSFTHQSASSLTTRNVNNKIYNHNNNEHKHKHVNVYNNGISTSLKMGFIDDAFRFFSNMNKEASAKHILIKGPNAIDKLKILKKELEDPSVVDISAAFSELASKTSECPSANRGGNLGTFKPGMMVKEFDRVCFEEDVGKIHGPIETQFGAHLILITRRYEGKDEKK